TQPVSSTNPYKVMTDLKAEAGNDIDPHYLPDGRIVFSSDRQTYLRGLQGTTGLSTSPGLDEERRDPVFMLHVMDANGDKVEQITFNQSHEFNPTVLQDGRILFSRWEHTGPRNEFSLYTVNPDGTGLDVFYGTHTYDGVNNRPAFVSAEQMQDGQLLSILTGYRRPRSTLPNENGIHHYNDGELVIIDQANFIEMDQKRFTSTSQSTVGQVSATDNQVPVDGSLSQYGRYYSAFPIWEDGGGDRALVSWSLCRLTDATEEISLPCVDENIRDPDYKEADPRFGIYMYDLNSKLKKPIVNPEDGMAAVDPVAIMDRPFNQRPVILPDLEPDPVLDDRDVGTVHIKSVYDTQGDVAAPMVDTPLEPLGRQALTNDERNAIPLINITLDPLTGKVVNDPMRTDLVPRTVADIATMSDPLQPAFNQRVARFVRITKAVPTIDDNNINGDDFGRSGGYEMREILGYAPVEPDGSVYMEVPANVPFTIQVLDAQGRAFQSHTAWLQVKPGEQRVCNGCHSPRDGQQSINLGAQSSIFPNTEGVLAQLDETMAEARYKRSRSSNGTYGQLTMDLVDNDIWPVTDELTEITYAGVTVPPVSNSNCETDWNWKTSKCRIVINYEQDIQPLWDADRGPDITDGMGNVIDSMYRCTRCHNDDDPNAVPPGYLVLDTGSNDINTNHVTVQAIRSNRTNTADRPVSYDMLFISRPRIETITGGGTRFIVRRDTVTGQPIDADGNIIAETDYDNLQFIEPRPPAVRGGAARARDSLLVDVITGDVPTATVDHTQMLSEGEKRLIIEWIDNGGQVYNDPVAAAVQ
ncbi:MAG: hypothetical protein PVJ39_17570, partial [Gammaproteobacteria bacterium]